MFALSTFVDGGSCCSEMVVRVEQECMNLSKTGRGKIVHVRDCSEARRDNNTTSCPFTRHSPQDAYLTFPAIDVDQDNDLYVPPLVSLVLCRCLCMGPV